MIVLGVNSAYHESSAALLVAGRLVAAVEEERFNRRKHGKEARSDNPDELPDASIAFCLERAGVTAAEVDHIAFAADPEIIRDVAERGLPSPWSDPADQRRFLDTLPRVPDAFRARGFDAPFHWIAHHTAHAASAFYVSPHDEAAVLVLDALGDDAFSTRLYHGRPRVDGGAELEPLGSVRYPASLGYLWELVSVYLGFGVYDAAKVMGLAAYGDPTRFAAAFDRLVWPTDDGGFDMAHDALRFSEILYYPPSADTAGLERAFGVAPRRRDQPLGDDHHDVAAALQALTDRIVLHLAHHLHERTGSPRLCLAGGVALNCVSNQAVLEHGPYDEVWVQPAAHDGGLSLGAAFAAWHEVLGQPRAEVMHHAYWGPSFDDTAIAAELARHDLVVETVDDLEAHVAGLLVDGLVVGWFQDAMELGPRALGHRSILADPRDRRMREILNHKVKHREYFRPLAPSVLAEEAAEWFDIPRASPAADFMLLAQRSRADKRDRMGAVLHVDNTCRIQTVHRDVSPRYHRLISCFRDLTGVPMVLNTSFNDQEPIICTPADAVATFLKTEIDALAIGSYVVRKPT